MEAIKLRMVVQMDIEGLTRLAERQRERQRVRGKKGASAEPRWRKGYQRGAVWRQTEETWNVKVKTVMEMGLRVEVVEARGPCEIMAKNRSKRDKDNGSRRVKEIARRQEERNKKEQSRKEETKEEEMKEGKGLVDQEGWGGEVQACRLRTPGLWIKC